ncbi:MAG: phosphoribosylanthranilate isomerase [Woeseiaceae bacterium]|nr:phosphoribosylanthranilate isomerase [Woeseiaceae bacterium]
MFVKICGLRTKAHVDAAVAAGANAVGCVFADSVRRVVPRHAAEITVDVPKTVKRVAVMLHPANDEWQEVLLEFRPDILQTDAEDFASLDVPEYVGRWPVYREGGQQPPMTGMYVYEGAKSGCGETVDWSRAAELARHSRMILAGGLGAANVGEAIATVRPYGVDVSSAVESAPGDKDPALITEFITVARAAETTL